MDITCSFKGQVASFEVSVGSGVKTPNVLVGKATGFIGAAERIAQRY